MDGKLFVDFTVYNSQRSQLEQHISDSQTENANACHALEQHIDQHLSHLPTVREPLLELVGLMRQRHEQTRQFLTDTWLPMLTDIVKDAGEIKTSFIKDNEEIV
ncbi:MAG TPA: hypothetical protein VKB76_06850 [Ktedonobacterales bacterium]|nr:hypothetical protein [Ktedonobacterales bacterium]